MSSEAVERRLAAILAADVVGYSRLMGADEAGTLAQLNAHRAELIDPAIKGHQGRIVKTMGDGLLVEFASVVDAVRCAVHIQHGMAERQTGTSDDRKMLLRIGINLGDIIVEGDDIHGDGVNVAARLEGLADPGGVFISGDAFRQIRNKLDVGFEDLGEKRVKNIAEPVSVYRVLTDVAAGTVIAAKHGRKAAWRWSAGAVAAVIVAAVLGWNFGLRQSLPTVEAASIEMMAFPLPDKPSIVVLPFDNLSGDPEQSYFADGLTDDVITSLSKLSGLFVISRNTAFEFRGEEVSVKSVAEELGVRYVLDGSVRRAGETVRINAQLIEATTGETLWAERFDGDADDIFALQDDINARIVSAMAVELTAPEQEAQGPQTRDARAYDAFLRGADLLRKNTAADTGKAVVYLRQAIDYDPGYSQAYSALAAAYWTGAQNGWLGELGAVSVEGAQTEARAMLDHAMQVNPTSDAYALEAEMAIREGQQGRAVEMAAHSVEMAPSEPEHQARLGQALTMAGRPDEALDHLKRAARRNPRGHYLAQLGLARFALGEYEEASALFEQQLERNPWHVAVAAPLAASYAHLGRQDEAQDALKRLVEGVQKTRGPQAEPRISVVVSQFAFSRAEDRERLAEGLRKAGLPE